MTPAELREEHAAWVEREKAAHEYRRQMVGWGAALVIANLTGKRVSVRKLIGETKSRTSELPKAVARASFEERWAEWERHKAAKKKAEEEGEEL